MYACVVKDATALVDLVAIGVTRQDDAYKISANEKSYTKCFDNDSQLREIRNMSK